ncbi:hypothetical protein RRG39_01580 [Mycoplasmopsis cynos]|uniref:hypothetical protein n=1 Tax=Mycoplasmopsis cynos TaxID=171284 RepID=UPI002AFEB9C8|nr:hypothetical protein [Mycoplasmopsis cynos]WQQ17216.1 hypothetical protein RRG39_01580 [Mycoplasmopsis cynos]
MKFRLSLLLNASIIVCTPLAVSAQGKSETKKSKTTQEILAHDSDVYSAKPLERPDYDDYDDVDTYGLYWDAEAFKTHYDMTFAYRILKKLIGFNGEKLEKLPYKEKLKDLIPSLGSEFEKIFSSYTFATHNELWKSFIKLWDDVKFNYGSYLKEQYKKKNNNSNDKITDDLRSSATYSIFISKANDIFQVRTMVAHFEAINLFIKHKENNEIKNLILQLFKVDRGVNLADAAYKNTLDDSLPILEKIREKAGENLVSDIAKQVEEENKHDKLMYDALLSARRAYGSPEYNEKIKPLVKKVSNISTDQSLRDLINIANAIYISEKEKVDRVFEELKDKDKNKNFKDKINKARNVGLLRDIYADITTQKIKEFQEELSSLVEKTNGSNDYNDFKDRLDSIKNKNDVSVKQKQVDKEAFEKKWKDFGANQMTNKVNIKEEKDKQREKLAIQLKEQAVTLEQLEALKQETNNLYLEESDKTRTLINSIDSHINKNKKLEEFKKARDIKTLKKIAEEAKQIKEAEDLEKAKSGAAKAVQSAFGSIKYDEYQKMLMEANNDIVKLNELIKLAGGEYEAKSNEVKANIDSLDDKKDFKNKFKNVKNIADLEELNKKILPEKKIQDLARAQKRAKIAVESTNGSKQYEAFLKRLNDNNEKTDELNKLASEAENVYNDEKQKVVDVFEKLLDKKQYRDKIDKAINITSLKALFTEISAEISKQQKKQPKPKTSDKKENENKTNVAAIVTPLVLIPTITAAGFGIWYALKHRKKSD